MELDLEAVSEALERLVGPSNSNNSLPTVSKQRKVESISTRNLEKNSRSSTHRGETKNNEIQNKISKTIKKPLEVNGGTQEILVSPNKNKQHQQTQLHSKLHTQFVSSPNQILCRVVEASGLGASAVLISSSFAGKRKEDKSWTTNLFQTPNPYIILNSLTKNYFRKEVVSHISATVNSPGIHVERIRDILLRIVFDNLSDETEEIKKPIEHLVISCSNHPRTGYVSVLRVKDFQGQNICVIIPGTLIGPFLKVTLFPKDTIRVKVIRISAIELAFADSWTERRIIEEPLGTDEDDLEENYLPLESSLKKIDNKSKEKHSNNNNNNNNSLNLLQENKDNKKKISSLVNSSTAISTVDSVHEDDNSVLGIQEITNNSKDLEETNINISLREEKIDVYESETVKSVKSSGREKNKNENILNTLNSKDAKTIKSVLSFSNTNSDKQVSNNFTDDLGNKEIKNVDFPNVLDYQGEIDIEEKRNIEIERKRIPKSLIAWSIKRRLLQNSNIMRSLRDDNSIDFENENSELNELKKLKETCSDSFCSLNQEIKDPLTSLQARRVWNAVSCWNHHDALLEVMTNSSAFCVTIACTSEEILASLPQPYNLQILLVFPSKLEKEKSLYVDYFELMMKIAYGERRRGREAELIFRMKDGFGCLLHPHRDINGSKQWLLVSVHNDHLEINEWFLEALSVYEKISRRSQFSLERKSSDLLEELSISSNELNYLAKPPVLRSILDFACLFNSLLPAIRPWLFIGDMCYYGDVQPALSPFIDDCGVIQPTCWFHCLIQGTVRSILLSLPGAKEITKTIINEDLNNMPPTTQRRLACMTIRKYEPFCGVWQPHSNAVKVILSNSHVLHHIELLDGILMDRATFTVVTGILPKSREKFEIIENDDKSSLLNSINFVMGKGSTTSITKNTSSITNSKVRASSELLERTSSLAFQVLSTALRRSWLVVGLVIPIKSLFQEDIFMDTVLRWAYNLPRVIVLFFCDYLSGESLFHLSTRFLEAFAPVTDFKSALDA